MATLRVRLIACAALATMLAARASVWAGFVVRDHHAEAAAFRAVYYAALFGGRDPDSTLRKAHFTTNVMVRQLGMTRADAAAEVARFMIVRGGGICVGG
jgi:hypothetical protein